MGIHDGVCIKGDGFGGGLMGWFSHVSDSMYLALCAVFEVDPEAESSLKRFVPAYINNATNIQAPRNMNICYYAISQPQETIFDYFQTKKVMVNGVLKMKIEKEIPFTVLFTFYGDNADDDAEHFWERIFWDSGYGCARSVLRKKKIVPMGRPERPLALYETEGTFQRRRCDVRMNFAYLHTSNGDSGQVDERPDLFIDVQE